MKMKILNFLSKIPTKLGHENFDHFWSWKYDFFWKVFFKKLNNKALFTLTVKIRVYTF